MIKLSGLRVIRSQDWKSGDQDGGESSVGTLVPKNFVEQLEILFPGGSQKRRLDDYNGITIELALDSVNEELARDLYLSKPGMINVIWDCGMQADYRAGREDAFDLKILDEKDCDGGCWNRLSQEKNSEGNKEIRKVKRSRSRCDFRPYRRSSHRRRTVFRGNLSLMAQHILNSLVYPTQHGMTVLHLACLNKSFTFTEVVNMLLVNEIDLEKEDDKGRRAIHFAVKGRNLSALHKLILFGADLNTRTKHKLRTALHMAVDSEFVEGAELLIEYGCDVNLQDSEGDTPLHNAAYRKKSQDKGGSIRGNARIVDAIVRSRRVNLAIRNKLGWTVFHAAVFSNNLRLAEIFLVNGPKDFVLDMISGTRTSALHIACSKGYYLMVSVLYHHLRKIPVLPRSTEELGLKVTNEMDLHVDAKDDTGKTPLLLACSSFSDYHLIEALVRIGCNVNASDDNGDTAIILIAKKLRRSGKIILLEYEASLIYHIYRHYRAHGYKETMEKYPGLAAICFLIAKGGNLDVVNQAGESATDIMDDLAATTFLKAFVENPQLPVVPIPIA